MITYSQAIVIGAVQGVTELFPISSLGHSVLVADWVGGNWKQVTIGRSGRGATYLAFVVALHVATAVALLAYYWRDWLAIVTGFASTLRTRRAVTVPQRLAWLIVLATLPVAVLGPLLDRPLHALFDTPVDTSIFLTVNGVVLVVGEGLRRRNEPSLLEYGRRFGRREAHRAFLTGSPTQRRQADRPLAALGTMDALGIGIAQAGALLTGFSRAGLTMVGGLWRGLENEHAAKFAFLLATPTILGAGLFELPELAEPRIAAIRGPVLLGAFISGASSWLAVRYLERYFRTRTLLPFATYCIIAGTLSIIRFV
ncbi:undecaprenyl-diphosphate phosphatase [Nocardia sp. NPDC020380]|uniref:undecaprenyl-diphosphate phosphatase n=1 Tax=Nocardia sp. NPDC020380 TaxID=3364309 RepID=UPI003792056A